MMKKIKTIVTILVLLSIMTIGLIGCATIEPIIPIIPKGNIPSDIPADVRKEIEGLYSVGSLKRAYAAWHLGNMGERAVSAVPFLIGLIDDRTALTIEIKGAEEYLTSVHKEALCATAKIGYLAVEPVISALSEENPGLRWRAAFVLGELKVKRAVNSLTTALSDQNGRVRKESAEALRKIRDIGEKVHTRLWFFTMDSYRMPDGKVASWGAVFNVNDFDFRMEEARELQEIADSQVVEPLIAALKDKDRNVRAEAAKALGNIKDSSAVGSLVAALNDKDKNVREEAAWALGEIKDPHAVITLIICLKDTSTRVRWNVAEALGKIEDPCAVEPLIDALKVVYPLVDVRGIVAWALGNIKDPRAVEPLIDAMKDDRQIVRWFVIRALGKIKDPRALEPLITLLKEVCLIAALDEQSVFAPDMRRADIGYRAGIRDEVVKSLKNLTGEDLGEDPIKWQRWWEKNKPE